MSVIPLPPRIPQSLNAADGYIDLLKVNNFLSTSISSTNVVASGYVLGGTTTVPVGLVHGLSDGTMVTTAGAMSGAVSIGTGSLTATGAVSGLTVAATTTVAAGTTVTGGTGVTATTGNVVATAGNVIAGSSGNAGTVGSFPATATSGELILAAVTNASGNFNTTISNASSVAQSQVVSIPDSSSATANFIVSKSAGTQHITTGALQVDAGIVSSGISTGGIAGGLTLYPTTASNGSLKLAPVGNAGNFAATVSDVSTLGQASVYTIPDPGSATANFIVSKSAGTQHITTGALQVDAGIVSSGISTGGTAGGLTLYPSAATKGSLQVVPVANTGNTNTTITNVAFGQATTFTLQDPVNATANFAVAPNALVNNNLIKASGTVGLVADAGIVAANVVVNSAAGAVTLPNAINATSYPIVVVNITVTVADLNGGGKVLLSSSGAKSYQIIDMYLNSGGTNFSGGAPAGDRLGQVTDGVTVYSVVPAAIMQALVNSAWGDTTSLPMPVSSIPSTPTSGGSALLFKYSGGANNYAAGSLVMTVIAIQIT